MKKFCLMIIFLISITLIGCAQREQLTPAVEVTVSAAISLKDVLLEIQKNYQIKYPNVKINYNLGASGALQKQIEEGAPVDIFISAAPKQMDDLEKKALIKTSTRKNLLTNQLVLITKSDSTLGLDSFKGLSQATITKFAMGAPDSVPAGQYTKQVLTKLQLVEEVMPKAVLAKDVRAVLTYVETGNVEAGTVYRTDAVISNKVKIVATAAPDSHEPIIYPLAILSASKQNKAAQDFTTYLASPEASQVFEKYGFTAIK